MNWTRPVCRKCLDLNHENPFLLVNLIETSFCNSCIIAKQKRMLFHGSALRSGGGHGAERTRIPGKISMLLQQP